MLPAIPVIRSLWISLFFVNASLAAGADERNVWIFLRDKIDKEERIVEWREGNQGHSISHLDLPVRGDYIEEVRQAGVDIRTTSRWFNALSARVTPEQESALGALSCVRSIGPVRQLYRPQPKSLSDLPAGRLAQQSDYGVAFEQLAQAEVIPLHQLGYTGSGVRIAVIDNGFHYTTHRAFELSLIHI